LLSPYSYSYSYYPLTLSLQVHAVDLQPIVNTILIIQSNGNFTPLSMLNIVPMDIRTDTFRDYVFNFKPTHATCLIGLRLEERAFLRLYELTCSVLRVAVLKRSKGKTKFSCFGFTHLTTIQTKYAESGEVRRVLVAERLQISDV
jgi:hypothetical protein